MRPAAAAMLTAVSPLIVIIMPLISTTPAALSVRLARPAENVMDVPALTTRLVPVLAAPPLKLSANSHVITDRAGRIMLDHHLVILLRLEDELLRALAVLEADLITTRTVHRAARLHSALSRVSRQTVRRLVGSVIDTSDNDRTVRIPIHEGNHHLLPDTRQP